MRAANAMPSSTDSFLALMKKKLCYLSERASVVNVRLKYLLGMVCLTLNFGAPTTVYAISTDMMLPHNCVSAGSGPDWNRPNRAEDNDGQSATAGDDEDISTEQLICRDYEFSIPSGATINGITATIRRRSSNDADDRARDSQVQIFKTAVPTSAGKARTGTTYDDSFETVLYGDSSDLWGQNWTPSDINGTQFGLVFRARLRDNDDTVSVDYIGITVDYTLPDTTPPVVSSIKRADFNPTNKPSVQWTVTFSENVIGVGPSDFQLVNTNLTGTPTITDVNAVGDSGSVYTVTATTGSGSSNGQLGLNLSDDNSIRDTSQDANRLGGNALHDGDFTGEKYDISVSAPSACFNDDFDRTTLGTGDWQVANSSGSFIPSIQNNRLRLTPATGNISTTASLLRSFPGAGNSIIVEFDYFAYGGDGADGMAVTLSDASVSPIPGAFGGSLGYAQKNSQQQGCTQGGCPGFAGGWLGVGIDEFGYFANAAEGRSSGFNSQTNDRPNVVTVRGSGSGQDGYDWHASSPALNPGTDISGSTPGPAHHYRITVDHSDNIHANVTVQRDAKDGSGMQTIISKYDAKSRPNQVPVPKNWLLSFTGSTGGLNNTHEIDNLQVCTTQPITAIALHHIRLEYPSKTCGSGNVVVKACANADCSVLYPGPVNLSLIRNSNIARWSNTNNTTYRFADSGGTTDSIRNGEAQVALTANNNQTGNVSISVAAVSPVPAQSTECIGDGSASNCVMNFTNACFGAVESGNDPASPIYTKLVDTNFALRILAIRSGSVDSNYNTGYCGRNCTPDPQVAVTLVDPTANNGNCSDTNAGLVGAQTIPITNGVGSVTFQSPKAAKNVKVRMTVNGTSTCSQDNFAIRPTQFTLTTDPELNPSANPPNNSYPAGSDFKITADPSVQSGYSGTPVLDKGKVTNSLDKYPLPAGAPPLADALLTGDLPEASAGANPKSTGTFQYQDVGALTFTSDSVIDETFTAVDQVTGIVNGVNHGIAQDCVMGSTSNTKNNNRYGCVIGSPETTKGRFRPHHYALSSTLTAACGNFTYMDQPKLGVMTSLQAMSASNVQLRRYRPAPSDGSYFGYTPLSTFQITGVGGSVDRLNPALPSFVWDEGSYVVNKPESTFKRAEDGKPDGSYENFSLKTEIVDPDGVMITSSSGPITNQGNMSSSISSPTAVRFGRLRLANANGSELLPLPIQMRTEYWKSNVAGFVTNKDDSCTALVLDDVSTNNVGNISGGGIASSSNLSFSEGAGSIILNKPTEITGKGSIDVCADLDGTTQRDPTCVATLHADKPWLQGKWGKDAGAAYDDDPTARATFGVFKSGPIIYLRELY